MKTAHTIEQQIYLLSEQLIILQRATEPGLYRAPDFVKSETGAKLPTERMYLVTFNTKTGEKRISKPNKY